jgi:hypothetical protein
LQIWDQFLLSEFGGKWLDTPMQSLRYLSVDLTKKQFAPILGEIKARSLEEAGEFHRGMAHAYVAVGKARCKILSICTAPFENVAISRTKRLRAPTNA